MKWIRLAAKAGNLRAQCNLGAFYQGGKGLPKDDAESVKWFSKAAEQGSPEGIYRMGLAYLFGIGVPKDAEKAANGINRAAALGSRAAIDVQRKLNGVSGDASADP